MDKPPSAGPSSDSLPSEVKLLKDVISCRTCDFFWQAGSRYDPFPGFNWTEDYPQAMQDFSGYPDDAEYWADGLSMPPSIHPPTVLEGCRKAPIMTVGLNPKLHAQLVNPAAGAWCYPQFYDEEGQVQANRYAYYHRYKTIYQESFDLDFMRNNLQEAGKFTADRDGWLLSAERVVPDEGSQLRQIKIKFLYDRDDTAREFTLEWQDGEHYILFFWPNSEIIPTGVPQFRAGEILAGKIDLQQQKPAKISRDLNGYYERMLPILDELTFMAGMKLKGAKLKIGEDVCQIDMISCASPGWGVKYDLKGETAATVEQNCISMHRDKGWTIKQYLQTQPAVLIFVSLHALALFHRSMHRSFPRDFNERFFTGPGELKPGLNAFRLLRACNENPWFINIDEEIDGQKLHFSSRLLVVPHFSTQENYLPQVRFPLAEEGSTDPYQSYKKRHPYAAQLLESGQPLYPVVMKRVNPHKNGTAVWLLGMDDPIQSILGTQAWGDLIDSPWYVDPNRMAAEVLMQELNAENLHFNHASGHLERNQGGCSFCDNALWKFPGGCTYNQGQEASLSASHLQELAKRLIGG